MRYRLAIGGTLALAAGAASGMVAQTTQTQPGVPYHAFQWEERLTLGPPLLTYARYDTPALCLMAAARNLGAVRRTGALDTLPHSLRDTTPTRVARVAEDCAASFAVSDLPSRDLLDEVALLLQANATTQAMDAIARRVAQERTTAGQADVLEQAIQRLLAARPARFDEARRTLAALDTLGRDARASQLRAHAALLTSVATLFVPETLQRDADSALAVLRRVSGYTGPEWQALFALVYANDGMLALYGRREHETVRSALTRMLQEKTRGEGPRIVQAASAMTALMAQLPLASLVDTVPWAPITATYWYGEMPGRQTYPSRGHVTLVMDGRAICLGNALMCRQQYGMVRRLQRRYATQGVDLVVVDHTVGYLRESNPLTPKDEGDALYRYFTEFWHLPAVLAFEDATVRWLPDGRRIYDATPQAVFGAEHGGDWGHLFLLDRGGRLALLASSDVTEAVLDAFLQKLVAESQ